MKYAVVESGGKQYVAREGEAIEVDRLQIEDGKSLVFKEVLFLADGKKVWVGNPLVEGAQVKGKVVGEVKAPKLIVYRYKPKVRQRVKRGHRQKYTRVTIESIQAPAGAAKTAAKKTATAAAKKKAAAPKKAPTRKAATATAKQKASAETKTTKTSPPKKAAPAKKATGGSARTKKVAPTRKTTGSKSDKGTAAPKKTAPKTTKKKAAEDKK